MVKKGMDGLRNELIDLLSSGRAHVDFDQAVAKIPKKYYGAPVEGIPYTLWRILQHMKISQKDILDYIKNPDYQESVWPDDYWPQEKSPPSATAWKKCVEQIRQDLQEIKELVKNPQTNLLESIPHIQNGPTILREILLVADHNSYHIGQIILLRGLLGIWKD
jgi:hypothetical protein